MILTGDLDVLNMYVDSQKKWVTKWLARKQVEWAGNFVIGKDCLDVGCGRGVLQALYEKQAKSFRSCDIEDNAWYSVEPDVCSAEALPYADDSFDTVFMLGVLEHIPNWTEAYLEAKRVLRPGGKLITVEPIGLIWNIINCFPLKHGDLSIHARWEDIRNPVINKRKMRPKQKCIIPGLFWGYVYEAKNL